MQKPRILTEYKLMLKEFDIDCDEQYIFKTSV